ncbi:MAG: hypothetical protein MUO26_12020 [Methanotrichaceae archaeon]|nr:hypothetical protein [Methanotrichaceae archaeon]
MFKGFYTLFEESIMDLMDELWQMEGIIAVAKLDDMCRIVDWKAKGAVSHEVEEATSKFFTSVASLIDDEARIAPRNWHPRKSFTYSGGGMTMIAAKGIGVSVDTVKVDFDKLFKKLGLFNYSK